MSDKFFQVELIYLH